MPTILIMYSNDPPSPRHVERLKAIRDDVHVVVADSEAKAIANAHEAEVFLGQRYLWQALPAAARLRWVQATAGGVDALLVPDLYDKRPLLSRTPIFGDVVAWHALAMGLALIRRLPASSFARGAGGEPDRTVPFSPPRRAVIFGMGAIGCELGKLLQSLGCHVCGVSRAGAREGIPCDRLLTPTTWLEALKDADLLFLTAPLTRETERIVNANVLGQLPCHAALVNVARGGLMDHTALADDLDNGRLAGAALDVIDGVTDTERARLFSNPNVIYTPKVSAFSPDRQERLETFIEAQVERYFDDGSPLHLVDYEASGSSESNSE